MVLYRKYRPQSLDELVGQESVRSALSAAFTNNKLSHAYLFCGPRGTGKTSTARILAKMVNCQADKDIPCNKCSSCISIMDGSNLDLIEIDAASNRGIEDIRSLRENIKLSPTSNKKKVYIIDEVHMLTNEAFNALLKTLEEPPTHVLFILATTDPQKLPATILSRVTRLDFKMAEVGDQVKELKRVAKEEGLELADEVIEILAKRAQGSFRDGKKLLDQVASMGKVTKEELQKSLLLGGDEIVIKLLGMLIKQDVKESLIILKEVLDTGVSPKEVTTQLLDLLREVMLVKHGVVNGENLKELAQAITQSQLIRFINSLTDSLEKLRYTSILSLPLELAIVEAGMSDERSSRPLDGKSDKIRKSENKQSFSASQMLTDTSDSPILRPTELKTSSDVPDEPLPIKVVSSEGSSEDMQKIADKWQVILETARGFNYSLEALLRSSKILSCETKLVTIEVPYAFHQRMLEAPKSKETLESIMSDVLERPVRVTTVLGSKPASRTELANVEVAEDDEIVRLASEIFATDSPN